MTVRDKTECKENWQRLIDRMVDCGGITEFLKQIEASHSFDELLEDLFGINDDDGPKKLNDFLRQYKRRFLKGETFRSKTCMLAARLLEIDAEKFSIDRYEKDDFLKQMAEISREIAKEIK